jgi:hypothetical protein
LPATWAGLPRAIICSTNASECLDIIYPYKKKQPTITAGCFLS